MSGQVVSLNGSRLQAKALDGAVQDMLEAGVSGMVVSGALGLKETSSGQALGRIRFVQTGGTPQVQVSTDGGSTWFALGPASESVTVDTALDASSSNPVQNGAIARAINAKADATALSSEASTRASADSALGTRVAALEQSGGSGDLTNYYTKSQTDTLLNGKQNALPNGTVGQVLTKTADGVAWASGRGGTVTVDTALSNNSENPVQNKAVKAAIDGVMPYPSNRQGQIGWVLMKTGTGDNAFTWTHLGQTDIESTVAVTVLSGTSGTVSPARAYSLSMSDDFVLSASSETGYGESVLFVTPGSHTFSVSSGITLSATMTAGHRYRLLVSWTPFGVLVEQTAEWSA